MRRTESELLLAQREGRSLRIVAPGLTGTILSVRCGSASFPSRRWGWGMVEQPARGRPGKAAQWSGAASPEGACRAPSSVAPAGVTGTRAPDCTGCTPLAPDHGTPRRPHDVEFKLPFPGRAFVRLESVLEEPPARFAAGTRVVTPYGSGVVAALRSSPDRVDYVVSFTDKRMADGKPVTGFLRPRDVALRTTLLFDEAIADANNAREEGNRLFKVCPPARQAD